MNMYIIILHSYIFQVHPNMYILILMSDTIKIFMFY